MNNSRNLIIIAILLMLINSSCLPISQIRMPEGWREPKANEANQEWRKKDPRKYLYVKGDFNGDGQYDYARILINDLKKQLGLFVFISKGDQAYRTILLDQNPISYIEAIGITIVTPGRYLTVCGEGVVDCDEGSPNEVVLENEAIEYFKRESASGYFYWNMKKEEFIFVGITD